MKRIWHVVATIGAVAGVAAGAFPAVIPLATTLGITPHVLSVVGAALAFVAHLPTVAGTGASVKVPRKPKIEPKEKTP